MKNEKQIPRNSAGKAVGFRGKLQFLSSARNSVAPRKTVVLNNYFVGLSRRDDAKTKAILFFMSNVKDSNVMKICLKPHYLTPSSCLVLWLSGREEFLLQIKTHLQNL